MTKRTSKPRRAWIAVVAVVVAGIAAWAISQRWGIGDPDSGPAPAVATGGPNAGAAGSKILDKPLWRELSRAQQLALAPLQPEWDQMDGVRKRKWLEMSRRFASMNPEEQQRVHDRMRQWIRLTPEERNLARENYNKVRKLAPGEKAATWESYKRLSSDQKRRLEQTAKRKNYAPVTTPLEPTIVAPTPCPAGTTRRGASCMSLQPPAALPSAPAITQPAPGAAPAAPGAAPAPATPAESVPAAPGAAPPGVSAPGGVTQPAATPGISNANG
ncbi:MAG: DUF3106 domain-containing protein [Pseudomonadota bacterium]